jgi:hypothetical protein
MLSGGKSDFKTLLDQLLKGVSAMRYGVFGGWIHFAKGQITAKRQKHRVIAKAIEPAQGPD